MRAVIFCLLLASTFAFPGKDLSEKEFEEKYGEKFSDKAAEEKAAAELAKVRIR